METAAPNIAITHFLGLELEVSGEVLRPRSETELLARQAIGLLATMTGSPFALDMCCGSGNLALALASRIPMATVWACDLTDDCVEATRRNIERHNLTQQVRVAQGDLFAALDNGDIAGQVDLVVANPPYISTRRLTEGDRAHLLECEPREAFDGGPYGVGLHQRLIAEALVWLKPGGWLAMEFGLGQERQIAALFKRARRYGEPVWHSDEAGSKRVVIAQLLAEPAS